MGVILLGGDMKINLGAEVTLRRGSDIKIEG